MKTLVRIGQAVTSGLGALALALVGTNTPAGFWPHNRHLFLVACVLVVVSGVVGPFIDGWRDRSHAAALNLAREIEDVCRAGLVAIARALELTLDDIYKLNMHAFIVEKHRLPPWRPDDLRRIGKFRLGGRRRSGPITWTRGKGVIGRCWETGAGALLDVSEAAKLAQQLTKDQWNTLEPQRRFHMSQADFANTSAFGTIFAWPMFTLDGRFVGCVSVDGPAGWESKFADVKVEQVLEDVAGGAWRVAQSFGYK